MVLGVHPFIGTRPARALQNTVSKHSSQFRGNAQHDALEFLLWLLDRMHEDLGAASPAQQGRGPAQVGGSAGWPWLGSGGMFGLGLGPGTPGCGARRRDGARPRPAGMGMLWFGGWLGRVWGAGTAGGVGRSPPAEHPGSGDILLLGEEELQPPRTSLPPAKSAVITARRLCCWRNE